MLADPPSPFMAPTITSLCKFWRILRPVVKIWVPDADQHPRSRKLTLSTAEEVFHKLLSWADENLKDCNEDGNLNQPHHVLVMQ
jgi:hypothetical protein